MTAVYELEMPSVKKPIIDLAKQEEIVASYSDDNWIEFFKKLQFSVFNFIYNFWIE